MGGLSVLTSVPTTPQPVCLLCASKGRHEVSWAWLVWQSMQVAYLGAHANGLFYISVMWQKTKWKHFICILNVVIVIFLTPLPPTSIRWSSVRSAVSLSTVSACHLRSAPSRRTRKTGSAGAANSATCADVEARAQRCVWGVARLYNIPRRRRRNKFANIIHAS